MPERPAAQKTDRVLQSSKLEDCIYRDLSRDDENLEDYPAGGRI